MLTMKYDDFVALVRETLREASRSQDKRLRAFSNSITRSIMAIYSNRTPELEYFEITEDDLSVQPNTLGDEFYEINAGNFPLAFDPDSIDMEMYEDGIDPFITVVLEIDRDAHGFNVSASDKNITGTSELGIHIAIETPHNFSRNKLGMLRNEIANAVRHELEHVTQGEASDQPGRAFARDGKYYEFLHTPDEVKSGYAKYLLEPHEIPAHIRGYAQNAKNMKELKQGIESFLAGYVKQDRVTSKEKEIIFNTWIDWAKNNINRKGY